MAAFVVPLLFPSCISKLLERLILFRLTFHLESNHLLPTCQAGFRPGRSSLDQILTLSQSIWGGFQKKKPPDRTILASVDFSKAFDSVCFINSSCSNSPLSSFFGYAPCFLTVELKSRLVVPAAFLSASDEGFPRGSVLGPVFFIPFVDDIIKDIPRGAHASLYADDLAIWSSSSNPLKASSVVQSSLNVIETWSSLVKRGPILPQCYEDFLSIQRSASSPFSLQIPIKPLSSHC